MATGCATLPSSELLEESGECDRETAMDSAKQECLLEPPKRKLYTDLCEVCEQLLSKYKCPNCGILSCSLQCVREHKGERGCNGKRNKTAYVRIRQFTDVNLSSDYHFLEEIERSVTNGSRIRGQVSSASPHSRTTAKDLKNQAKRRGINFFHLSHGMEKRTLNASFFDEEKKIIFWQIKLFFVESESEIVEERVCENDTLLSVLAKYIDPSESRNWILHRLKRYLSSPEEGLLSKVDVLLKAERLQGKGQRFYRTDCTRSIKDVLRHRNVVEFPEFHVVLKTNIGIYNILSSDNNFGVNNRKRRQKNKNARQCSSQIAAPHHPLSPEQQTSVQQEVAAVKVETSEHLSSRENKDGLAPTNQPSSVDQAVNRPEETKGTDRGLSLIVPYSDSEPEEGEVLSD